MGVSRANYLGELYLIILASEVKPAELLDYVCGHLKLESE